MRRNDNEQSLKEVLQELVGHYRKNDKYVQAEVKMAWQELIGDTIFNKTKLVYLKRKVLYIHLESAVLKEELSFGKAKIIEEMNRELGYSAIVDLEIY